ncbi:hypothetical protein [Ferruginibacter sp.]
MKKLMILMAVCCCINVSAQKIATTFSKEKPVQSVEWGTRMVTAITGYWEMAIPQLKKKFTKKLVDSIEMYTAEYLCPAQIKDALSHDNNRKYDINKLKVYLVAEFNNNFNGSFHGVEYVLWAPMADNNDFAEGELRNDFFFIVPKEAVTLMP